MLVEGVHYTASVRVVPEVSFSSVFRTRGVQGETMSFASMNERIPKCYAEYCSPECVYIYIVSF
jgi:hypothetical protein